MNSTQMRLKEQECLILTALQSFEVERARVLQYFAMMHTENLLVINDYFKLGESQ